MTLQRRNFISSALLALVSFMLFSCDNDSKSTIITRIDGSFPAFKGKSVSVSEFGINEAIPIDTVKIDDRGNFRFKIRRTGAGFYLIKTDNRNFITLVLDKEKKITVSSDGKNLRKSYSVKGSPDSELYRDFEMFLETNRTKVDSLSDLYRNYQRSSTFSSIQPELDGRYKEIFDHQRTYSLQFIENHCSSLASLLVINRRFGERKILDDMKDFDYYLKIDSCLTPIYSGNMHLDEHKRKIEAIRQERKTIVLAEKRMAIGNKVPNIIMQNPAGKEISLHSFIGKPVIIYFWASMDKISRQANANLKEILRQYSGPKPVVYAIGLESYKQIWQDAITKDGIQDWVNVTDYLNMDSSARTLFNMDDRFPYYVILDKEMRICHRGTDLMDIPAQLEKLQ